MIISFCELKDKEVVNLCDGKRLGFVADVEFESCSGRIVRLLLPPSNKYFSIFSSKNCIGIPWQNVEKIGNDIVLVRYGELPPPKPR